MPLGVLAEELSERYNEHHPLRVVCDWDKAPYEFRNDQGDPAGANVDLMNELCRQLGITCKFVMKEWSGAIKTFERGDADIIFANVRRYRNSVYYATENIINYNRVCAASYNMPVAAIPLNELIDGGVVLKPGDYSMFFFRDLDTVRQAKVEYQSPKVALQGLIDGDYKYFVWGEEPLKWKIKELNLENITINDVSIPVSEIHIIGHDKDLIYKLDDLYSRLKQSGEVQRMKDRWLHPERVQSSSPSWLIYAVLGALFLALVFYAFSRIAKAHVRMATRNSSDLNKMMQKALHMGEFHVMVYDIANDLVTNSYGPPLLPESGISLKEFVAHIHPDEVEEFTQKMEALLSGRERKFELRKRFRAFDGDHWLKLDGHAIVELDDDGRPAYIVNAINDITHDEETERFNYEVKRKYEQLSRMPFMAMSFYDKDGWLLDINDAMKHICGITPDNPATERFWSTLCLFDIPSLRSAYQSGDQHDLLACMHMDYSEMGIDRFVEYHIRPLFNVRGEVANYFVTTTEKNDERKLHCEIRQLESAMENTRERIRLQRAWLVYLLQNSERFLMRNDIAQQKIAFYRTPDSPEYVHPFDTFCKDYLVETDRQPFQNMLTDMQTRTSQTCTIHLKRNFEGHSGSVFVETFHPTTNVNGDIIGHEGISTDVTKLATARERLVKETALAKDSQRLKSGFMASMTHELRTPLNAIVGFTDVLGAIDDPSERSEYIRIIRSNCDMLQRLINDILEASSLSDGPTTIEAADVDFSKAFDDICLTLQQRVGNGVAFIKENPYATFATTLDIGRINQIITNFVTNAVKFTQKGYVRLGYRYRDHGLYISCEDTGVGIPEDKQDIIFDRFVKLDEFVQGTGMGLSICKTMAERLGGRIGVESEGPGKGSTFWIWIPCEHRLSASH